MRYKTDNFKAADHTRQEAEEKIVANGPTIIIIAHEDECCALLGLRANLKF